MRLSLLFIITLAAATAQYPREFALNRLDPNLDTVSDPGLPNNSVVDVLPGEGSVVYFSTSGGLAFGIIGSDNSIEFRTFSVAELPEGGNPGLTVSGSDIAVSGAVQEYAAGEYHPAGTGIAYSSDGGETWGYKPQPVDPADSPEYVELEWGGQILQRLAVTTEINNVSYDLAILDDYIYSASWAGGLQRFRFKNIPPAPEGTDPNPWEPIPLPEDESSTLYCGYVDTENFALNPNDPINGGNHNHKGFSVHAANGILWVGTANGINKGEFVSEDCINWTHYTAGLNGLSGDWVVGFEDQVLTDEWGQAFTRIWAVTWPTTYPEYYSLSYTDDSGLTWFVPERLEELTPRVYSLSANGDRLLASSENGLFLTTDGMYWELYDRPSEGPQAEEILTQTVYSAADCEDDMLIVGTPDGVAVTMDEGRTWSVHRFWSPAIDSGDDEDRFFAYPNPFYPNDVNMVNGDGHVRFVYYDAESRKAELHIFDFAMEQVTAVPRNQIRTAGENHQYEIIWNGRNDWGDTVANGVYFCRLKLGSDYYWTKLLVVN